MYTQKQVSLDVKQKPNTLKAILQKSQTMLNITYTCMGLKNLPKVDQGCYVLAAFVSARCKRMCTQTGMHVPLPPQTVKLVTHLL